MKVRLEIFFRMCSASRQDLLLSSLAALLVVIVISFPQIHTNSQGFSLMLRPFPPSLVSLL